MITIRDKVRFVETDMMGVVHHANYLRWFEMGRVAYLRACGISLGELMADGVIFPITEVRAKYKNSCTFDDDFEVQVKMSAFNKAKWNLIILLSACATALWRLKAIRAMCLPITKVTLFV